MLPRFCTLLLGCSIALAQSTLSGPSLGLVYDAKAQAIRPIWGIPGASTTGQPIATGFTVVSALISPAQDYALAVSSDGSLNVVLFGSGSPTSQAVAGVTTPDRMVLSPTGSSAVLFYKTGTVQIVSGLPGSPSAGPQIDITMLPNAPDVIAIADDGTSILAGVPENAPGDPAHGEVFLVPSDSSGPRSIATVQHASALAFFAQSHDALIADDAAATVVKMEDAAGAASPVWTFTDTNFTAPDSVQAAADGHLVFAASSKNGVLAILGGDGSNPIYVSCQCTPAELHPLASTSLYQVTEPANGLLWAFDANLLNPRVLFIPVPDLGAAQQ